ARNIRNVVFLRMPDNMIEFKQIIGRGTRLYEGKNYFTVYDFVGASSLFDDPDWDGEPLDPVPPKGVGNGGGNGGGTTTSRKSTEIIVKIGANRKKTISAELNTSFYMADGRLISAKEFIELIHGEMPNFFKSEDDLRKIWSDIDMRKMLMTRLLETGYGEDQFKDLKKLIDLEHSDIYDVLLHLRFDTAKLTRVERAENAAIPLKNKYNAKQFEFIEFVLDKYCKEGVKELDDSKLPDLLELKYGSLPEAAQSLGGMKNIKTLFEDFQKELYAA
ncbi:restriction endonuclease subunit R, partial [Crocinitomicaceae bacterium]|nr:restriction endonuclease subunit R [Crocinitomicaceae bacterium]